MLDGTSSILFGFLAVVLWVCLVAAACCSRHAAARAASISVSVLLAAAGWGMLLAAPPEKDVKDAFVRLRGKDRVPAEEIAQMLENPSAPFRYAALCYLVRKPDPTQAERILALFDDPDERVRMTAVESLGRLPLYLFAKNGLLLGIREEMVRKVIAALDDESLHVRCRAAEVIAALRFREGEGRLLKLVNENRNLYVALRAVESLYRLRPLRRGRK
jgi:HEAT repeat protein